MIIAVAGIKRSASTAQFNLIRIALQMAGYQVNICGHDYTPREVPEGEVDLVKRHPFSKEIAEAADHIFLTDRDDEGILASLGRMWGSGDPQRIPVLREHLNKWKQYPHLMLHYDLWKRDKLLYIGTINTSLFGLCEFSSNDVLKEFNKIKPPKDKQDPVTLLFPNHIS